MLEGKENVLSGLLEGSRRYSLLPSDGLSEVVDEMEEISASALSATKEF